MLDALSMLLIIVGLAFFAAGSVGLLRFPDTYTRLHALTKADNLGLGLVVLGLLIRVEAVAPLLKLVLIWALVLTASAAVSHLVAQRAWTASDRRAQP